MKKPVTEFVFKEVANINEGTISPKAYSIIQNVSRLKERSDSFINHKEQMVSISFGKLYFVHEG